MGNVKQYIQYTSYASGHVDRPYMLTDIGVYIYIYIYIINVCIYIYIQTSKYFHYVNLCESLQAMARKSHVVDLCVTVAEMLKSLDKTT